MAAQRRRNVLFVIRQRHERLLPGCVCVHARGSSEREREKERGKERKSKGDEIDEREKNIV